MKVESLFTIFSGMYAQHEIAIRK